MKMDNLLSSASPKRLNSTDDIASAIKDGFREAGFLKGN